MAVNGRPHIVYVTFDGLLEPLGYAQVARVVMGLADEGDLRVTVCSLEKDPDRRTPGREQTLEAQLRRHHVRWRRGTYAGGGAVVDVARNVRQMGRLVQAVVDEDDADLIHARSYVAASVARGIKKDYGIPYIFDTRGFWVDERVERGRWFDGPVRKGAARIWEAKLYGDASAAVTLTQAAKQEIENERMGPWERSRPVVKIPTCVDYQAFGLGTGVGGDPVERPAALADASVVVGYVGAINGAYRLDASLRLFDHLLDHRPDAHLLGLTRHRSQLIDALRHRRLPADCYTVKTVDHRQMPRWLQWIDWGLLLRDCRPEQRSYLGAMPTKLGEYFATGVRPIYWGLNDEVRRWIERADSGHVLDRVDEQALRRAAQKVASTPRCLHTLWGARWRTQSHFGLDRAVKRYRELYDQVLSQCAAPRMRALFLTEGTTVPASRFRVQQLVPHLEQRGIDCTVRPAYGDGYNRWAHTKAGPAYKLLCSLQRIPYAIDGDRFDVVFLQRPALPFSAVPEAVANWCNPRTIFDVDDAIFLAADGTSSKSRRQAFDAIVDRCAHVICGNQYLAEHTRDITPTTVLPTVVDTEVYRPAPTPAKQHTDSVVIGWMGTAANFDSLATIAEPLRQVVSDFDRATVRIVSNHRFRPLEGVDGVEQMDWSAGREVQQLQSFDIGLMPLVDTAVTRGKCGFKAIQYMAVGIPVVASPVGVNAQILEGEDAGVLADGPKAFTEALRRLVGDDQLRRQMGEVGRNTVRKYYSVQAVIDRYVELFEAVRRRAPRRWPGDEEWTQRARSQKATPI